MNYKVDVPRIKPTLTIKFDSTEEARELHDEIRQWNAHSASPALLNLFEALTAASRGINTYGDWDEE